MAERRAYFVSQRPRQHFEDSPNALFGRVIPSQPSRQGFLIELWRGPVFDQTFREFTALALEAFQGGAQHLLAAPFRLRPRTQCEGRSVTDVLPVQAVELCDPMSLMVELESKYRPLHLASASLGIRFIGHPLHWASASIGSAEMPGAGRRVHSRKAQHQHIGALRTGTQRDFPLVGSGVLTRKGRK